MRTVLEGSIVDRIQSVVSLQKRRTRSIVAIYLTPVEWNDLRHALAPQGSGLDMEETFRKHFGVDVLRGTIDDQGEKIEDPTNDEA